MFNPISFLFYNAPDVPDASPAVDWLKNLYNKNFPTIIGVMTILVIPFIIANSIRLWKAKDSLDRKKVILKYGSIILGLLIIYLAPIIAELTWASVPSSSISFSFLLNFFHLI